MDGVNKCLIKIADLAIMITAVDFGIPATGGLRTQDMQRVLFEDGLSRCDGYNKRSKHQTGNALDFFAYVDGKASWEKEHLAQVAAAFLQAACMLGIKIEWGGLWSGFQDMPHIQMAC